MGVFYDAVMKMRKNGRAFKEKTPTAEVKRAVESIQPSEPKEMMEVEEMAVKKNDKRANRKS